MSEQPRNPKNAVGPFYVVKGQCISCGAPAAEAPGLVTHDDEEGCYFHKQPATPGEVDDGIRAVFVSCIKAYRYGGTDPTIRRRLAELGHSDVCDHPLEGHPAVLRNRVRFALPGRDDATDVARLLLSRFASVWKDGRCTRAVTGDAHGSDFEFTSSEKYGSARRYTIERLTSSGSAPSSVYRGVSSAHVWLLAEDDGGYPPIWLHYLLLETGGVAIRWFSAKEWAEGSPGHELPY